MKELPAQPVKGLQDGIIVMQQLTNMREPVSGLELSRELGIEKTRVNRILKTLASLGIAYRTASRKYASGPGMHVLAAQSLAASGLFRASVKHLEELDKLGHTIALGVLWRDKVSYLFHHSPGTPFQEGIGKTSLYNATGSSLGMVLLSQKADEEILEIYKDKNDIGKYSNSKELLKHICEIRRDGYAALPNNEGFTIAVKIGNPAYAAIGMAGKIKPNEIEKNVDILEQKAEAIEEEIA